MIICTTQEVPGKAVEKTLGMVSGSSSYNPSGLIGEGWFKEDKYYQTTLNDASQAAIKHAEDLGADAIIGSSVCTSISGLAGGRIFISVTGTAVKLADSSFIDAIPEL